MSINQLSQNYSVSPQISVEDLPELVSQGFTTIISNRPDSEVTSDETAQVFEQAAASAGIKFVHLPMKPGELNLDHTEVLRGILNDGSGRTLGYCRSGGRAASLWAFAQTENGRVDGILSQCASCGYNLEGLRPILEKLATK